MKKWIGIGVVVILLVAGILIYKYYFQSTRTDQFTSNDQGFSYSGSFGDLEVGYADPDLADFGVPLYPGAKSISDTSVGEVTLNGNKFLMGSYTSADTEQKIIAYYQKQIEGAVTGTLESNVTETIIKSPNGTSISISTNNSGTSIILVKQL